MRLATAIIAALLAAPACAIAADAVQPAVPVDRQPPGYPDSVANADGMVKLSFKIGTDGHVHDASVIDSNPRGLFDSAALAAVANCIYRPRTVNSKAVEQPDNVIVLRFKPGAPADERAVVFSPAPYYPEAAYLAKAEGKVVVAFDVTADGDTTNVRAVEATTPGLFDEVAVNMVKAAEFEPLPNPSAPPTHLRRTVEFTMPIPQAASVDQAEIHLDGNGYGDGRRGRRNIGAGHPNTSGSRATPQYTVGAGHRERKSRRGARPRSQDRRTVAARDGLYFARGTPSGMYSGSWLPGLGGMG
ncbi:MAG: TonB family protein [Rhodospirillales bacterium]|nr:TonB family protein [Rhodospirillales bacterium]